MKKLARGIAFITLLASPVLGTSLARAADHADGTTTGIALALDPAADINDLFAWMSTDASTVNLVMSLFPSAGTASKFSDAVKYVFHTTSVSAYLGASVPRDIICTFTAATPQIASCWLTDPTNNSVKEYVTGDVSAKAGVASTDAKVKVFAGLRNDPFFFNLVGFRNATSAVALAIKDFTDTPSGMTPGYIKGFDTTTGNKCPILSSGARGAVTFLLGRNCVAATPAVDFFNKAVDADSATCLPAMKPELVNTFQTKNSALSGNILSIAITVEKSLLTAGGPVLNVWAATTK